MCKKNISVKVTLLRCLRFQNYDNCSYSEKHELNRKFIRFAIFPLGSE